jgi:hypothetical protein
LAAFGIAVLGAVAPGVVNTGGAGAVGGAPGVTWGTDNQHQLIPLYVYPDALSRNSRWKQACSLSDPSLGGSTIIANGNSAPTPSYNSAYAQAFELCHSYGQNVIGYVDTSYGAVPLATVERNISLWLGQYNGNATGVRDQGAPGINAHIDGIFLDQMAINPDASTPADGMSVKLYYSKIYQYAKSFDVHYHADFVGNPGAAATTDWQLNPATGYQSVDELVIWEGYASTLKQFHPPDWVSKYYPASSIAMLVHDNGTSESAVRTTCNYLKTDHAGWVDVTNGNGWWITLQSTQMFGYIRHYCG